MKMAVVGCEASGKTVFMAALADYYGRGERSASDLRLIPENAAANNFAQCQYRQLRCLRQWPPATNPGRTVEIKWSLRRGGTSLATIDMLEFGGETFRAAFRENAAADQSPSVRELLAYLGDADFVVVLVSLKDVFRDPGSLSAEEFERETESLWVTRGLLEFVRKRLPNAGVVIGLTQADRYRSELAAAGGAAEVFASRWPTVRSAAPDVPVVEVASVSNTDAAGNPAEGYRTNGVLTVMREISRQCFGSPLALETGDGLQRRLRRSRALPFLSVRSALLSVLLAAAAALWIEWPTIRAFASSLAAPKTIVVEKPVVVEKQVVVEKPVMVEKPVVVEKKVVVEKPVIVEKKIVVTNVVHSVVTNSTHLPTSNTLTNSTTLINSNIPTLKHSNILTNSTTLANSNTQTLKHSNTLSISNPRTLKHSNTSPDDSVVIKPAEPPKPKKPKLPPGFRTWRDHRGEPVDAKWVDVADDLKHVAIVTRSGKRINAVVTKFSKEDQAYVNAEIDKHLRLGETLKDGKWTKASPVRVPAEAKPRAPSAPKRETPPQAALPKSSAPASAQTKVEPPQAALPKEIAAETKTEPSPQVVRRADDSAALPYEAAAPEEKKFSSEYSESFDPEAPEAADSSVYDNPDDVLTGRRSRNR